MNRSQRLAVLGVLAVGMAAGVVLYIARMRPTDDDDAAARARNRAGYLASVPAPPQDLPPGVSANVRARPAPGNRPVMPPAPEVFRYDPAMSLEENLARYRAYCAADTNSTSMVARSAEFESELLRRIGQRWDLLLAGVDDATAPAFYRMIMLRCLVKSGFAGRADVVWRYALDASQGGLSTVAAEALRELGPSDSRPEAFLQLIDSASGDRAVFALQAARFHMNDKVLARVERIVEQAGGDMNVRVAAVHAVGDAHTPDAQNYLMNMARVATPAKAEPLSEASVLKRSAIWRLDATQPEAAQLVRRVAQDSAEDSGVRRKAMLKVAESGGPDAESLLAGLMRDLPEDQLVLLKGCGEALLQLGTTGARAALDRRVAALKTSDARSILRQVIRRNAEKSDGGISP